MQIELNIGLNVEGGDNGRAAVNRRHFVAAVVLQHLDFTCRMRRHEVLYVGPAGETQEDTLVARLDPAISPDELQVILQGLSTLLEQDCIAVLYVFSGAGAGELVGPRAAKWGAFNPDFFVRP
jgi:hypothetical protein